MSKKFKCSIDASDFLEAELWPAAPGDVLVCNTVDGQERGVYLTPRKARRLAATLLKLANAAEEK